MLFRSSENYLVEWYGDVAHTGALLSVFLILSAGSAVLVSRYHRRQQAHAARLRETLADLRDRDQALGITERIGGLGVFSIDLRTGLSHRSAQLMEIFGAAPDKDFPLEAWRDGLHPDDRAETLARFDEGTLQGGRAFDHVYRFIRPDGEVRWFLEAARIFRNAQGQPLLAPLERLKDNPALVERASVGGSLKNLMTYPWVRERVEAGNLVLHGWWFDLDTGDLWATEPGGTQLMPVID